MRCQHSNMNKRLALIVTIGAAVLLAGCTMPGNQPSQEEEKPKIIQIEGPDCFVADTPCSSGQLTKYDGPAEVRVVFNNYGDTETDVQVGSMGREVMVSKCNDELVEISDFTARTIGTQQRSDVTGNDVVELEGGQSLEMEWELDIVPADQDLSSLGYSCPMDFSVGYTQQIESSRQIQLKADESVPDVQSLDSRTSSKRPVGLAVDAPERTLTGSGRTVVMRGYFQNKGSGEITSVNSIEALTSSGLSFTCGDGNIRMYGEGKREGQSYRRVCRADATLSGTSSQIEWIGMEGEYEYNLPLNDVTIQLVPVE